MQGVCLIFLFFLVFDILNGREVLGETAQEEGPACTGGDLPFAEVSISQIATIRTHGNAGFEFFSIDSIPYLAIANFWDGSDRSMGAFSEVISLHNNQQQSVMNYSKIMEIRTQGAHGADYFETPLITDSSTPKVRRFLVFPNYYGCEEKNVPCKATTILVWNEETNQFDFFQSLRSDGPSQSDHFSIFNVQYLVLAENFSGKVSIYRYHERTDIFVLEQVLRCPGVAAIAVIVLQDHILLAAASYYDADNNWYTRSPIFIWQFTRNGNSPHRSNFQLMQQLPTQGAHDVEMIYVQDFHPNGEDGLFMFFSEDRNHQGSRIDSQMFEYDFKTREFILIQTIPTYGAHAAELFTVKFLEHHFIFLAIANFGDRHGKHYVAESPILAFSNKLRKFITVASLTTVGATDWEYFELDGRNYLALSNEGDLQSTDPSEDSIILELTIASCPHVSMNTIIPTGEL